MTATSTPARNRRSASGVKLVTLEPGDVIAAACSVQEAEVEGEDNGDIQTDLPLV